MQAQDKFQRRFVSRFKMSRFVKLCFYCLIILLLMSVLLFAIIVTFIEYNKLPIYTEVNTVQQYKAKFPAVTICPVGNGYKETILQVSGLIEKFPSNHRWFKF